MADLANQALGGAVSTLFSALADPQRQKALDADARAVLDAEFKDLAALLVDRLNNAPVTCNGQKGRLGVSFENGFLSVTLPGPKVEEQTTLSYSPYWNAEEKNAVVYASKTVRDAYGSETRTSDTLGTARHADIREDIAQALGHIVGHVGVEIRALEENPEILSRLSPGRILDLNASHLHLNP